MGAAASTNINDVKTNIVNTAKQNCGKTTNTNTISLQGANLNCLPGCSCPVTIAQGITVDADCLIATSVTSTTDALNKMGAQAATGLGIAVATNKSVTSTDIENYLSSKCGDLSNTNTTNLTGLTVNGCGPFIAPSNISAQKTCQINAINDILTRAQTEQTATATGLLGGTSGIIAIIVIAVVAMIVIGVGGYFYVKSQTPQVGGESDSLFDNFTESLTANNKETYALWIVVLVVVVLIILTSKMTSHQVVGPKQMPVPVDRRYVNQEYFGLVANDNDNIFDDPVGRRCDVGRRKDDCLLPYYNSLDTYYEPLISN